MSLIRKSTDLTLPTAIKMMIYAQAATGKTTLSLSAPKPLLLDFDGGVNRINLSHLEGVDIVQVANWEEIKQLLASPQDLAPYQTIVPDTVGKLLDCIITYKCGLRQPRVQGRSGINAEFLWFTKQLASLNKHIIFIAHRDTRKEGDRTVFIRFCVKRPTTPSSPTLTCSAISKWYRKREFRNASSHSTQPTEARARTPALCPRPSTSPPLSTSRVARQPPTISYSAKLSPATMPCSRRSTNFKRRTRVSWRTCQAASRLSQMQSRPTSS